MNAPSEDPKTGLEVLYRLLCLPYFVFICLYWLGYLYAPYMSYAVWKAHAIFMDSSESTSLAVAEILYGYLAPLALVLLCLKLSTTAYSWAILSPLRLRLYNKAKNPQKNRSIIEYLILVAFLIAPVIIAHYRHNAFGSLSSDSLASGSALATTDNTDSKGLNKDVKKMSTVAVDKIRVESIKGLELMSLAETLSSQPPVKNAEEITLQFTSLQKDAIKADQEAKAALDELRKLVRESREDKHWAYLQAVDRYKCLCDDSLKLWMLSLKARDLTNEEGNEARKKMDVECKAIRKLTDKEGSESRKKMDAACEAISDLTGEEGGEARKKMDTACKAIRESCFEVVKSGFYISKEYQIVD